MDADYADERRWKSHSISLWVHLRHHVLDGSVLARGVHPLQDHEQAAPALGVQPVLQLGQPLGALGQPSFRPAPADPQPRVGVHPLPGAAGAEVPAARLSFRNSSTSAGSW